MRDHGLLETIRRLRGARLWGSDFLPLEPFYRTISAVPWRLTCWAGALALAVDAAMLGLLVRIDVNFLEGSLSASQRRYQDQSSSAAPQTRGHPAESRLARADVSLAGRGRPDCLAADAHRPPRGVGSAAAGGGHRGIDRAVGSDEQGTVPGRRARRAGGLPDAGDDAGGVVRLSRRSGRDCVAQVAADPAGGRGPGPTGHPGAADDQPALAAAGRRGRGEGRLAGDAARRRPGFHRHSTCSCSAWTTCSSCSFPWRRGGHHAGRFAARRPDDAGNDRENRHRGPRRGLRGTGGAGRLLGRRPVVARGRRAGPGWPCRWRPA